MSHRKAWQAIVDQQLDAGFVIEDDIELTDVFNAAFHAVSNHFEPGSFVRFTFRDDREDGREVFRNNQVRIIIPNPIGLGMVAQLVSFDAAKSCLQSQNNLIVLSTRQSRCVGLLIYSHSQSFLVA